MTSLYTDCILCKGTGWVYERNQFDETGGDVVPMMCFLCEGTGQEFVADDETLEAIENAGAIK